MEQSPITELLRAVDSRDPQAAAALFSAQAHMLTVYGDRAEGLEGIQSLLTGFLEGLRACTHDVTAQWHEDGVWIAEVDASYELKDFSRLSGLPRVFVLRQGPDGIRDLRVYGAHEHPLADRPSGEAGTFIGGQWAPPL